MKAKVNFISISLRLNKTWRAQTKCSSAGECVLQVHLPLGQTVLSSIKFTIRFIILNCSQERGNTRVHDHRCPVALGAKWHDLQSLRVSSFPLPLSQWPVRCLNCLASVRPHWKRMIYSWTGSANINASGHKGKHVRNKTSNMENLACHLNSLSNLFSVCTADTYLTKTNTFHTDCTFKLHFTTQAFPLCK